MTTIQKISLVFLTGLFSCKGVDKDNPVPRLTDRPFDKLRLTDLDNNQINLKNYQGKAIFINFWATWCKPCKQEMPSIERAKNLLGNENIVFLMASGEILEEIKDFKVSNNYNFNYTRIENSEDLDIQALPTSFIFDAGGTLVFSETGFRNWDEAGNMDLIRKIINKNE